MKDLKQIALDELRAEEERKEINRIKQEVRQKRQTLLFRIWYTLRYMKPVIKWEYKT